MTRGISYVKLCFTLPKLAMLKQDNVLQNNVYEHRFIWLIIINI